MFTSLAWRLLFAGWDNPLAIAWERYCSPAWEKISATRRLTHLPGQRFGFWQPASDHVVVETTYSVLSVYWRDGVETGFWRWLVRRWITCGCSLSTENGRDVDGAAPSASVGYRPAICLTEFTAIVDVLEIRHIKPTNGCSNKRVRRARNLS